MPFPVSAQQWEVDLVLEGRNCGTWTTHEGGAMTAESSKVREGYGLPELELGSTPSVGDVTLTRPYRVERDGELEPFLYSQCGHGQGVLKLKALDGDGFAVGRPKVRGGVLLEVTPPDFDLSSTDAAVMSLTFGMHGVVVA
jgi:hypothetical protein